MGDFVSIAVIVLLVLLGPWVLVWRVSARRKRERVEDQDQWRELTSRTYELEQTVRALQAQRSSPAAEGTKSKTSDSPVATTYASAFPSPSIFSPPPAPPVVESSPSVRVAERWVTEKTIEPAPSYSSTADQSTLPASTPVTPLRPPSFTTAESAPSLADRFKSSLDVEEMLGTNWLNKL